MVLEKPDLDLGQGQGGVAAGALFYSQAGKMFWGWQKVLGSIPGLTCKQQPSTDKGASE